MAQRPAELSTSLVEWITQEVAHTVRLKRAMPDRESVCLGPDGHSQFHHLLFRRDWPPSRCSTPSKRTVRTCAIDRFPSGSRGCAPWFRLATRGLLYVDHVRRWRRRSVPRGLRARLRRHRREVGARAPYEADGYSTLT